MALPTDSQLAALTAIPTTTSRVLLVEDNEVNSYLIRFVLERAGLCGAGRRPMASRVSRPRALERPDLILMDIGMPVMDGYEATERLKADPGSSGVPVVALSAHAMEHEKERAYQAGCVAHIEKPIDMTTFIRQVQTHLSPRRCEAAVGAFRVRARCTVATASRIGVWCSSGKTVTSRSASRVSRAQFVLGDRVSDVFVREGELADIGSYPVWAQDLVESCAASEGAGRQAPGLLPDARRGAQRRVSPARSSSASGR